MSDLHNALGDIGNIRRQVARATEFRGYGPATLAATGICALLAAAAQSRWIPAPETHGHGYLWLWLATAVLSAALSAAQMVTRTRRIHSGLSNEMLRQAVEQFLPAAAAGLLVTLVLAHFAAGSAWMLPGLWQIFYSLGIFSSARFLPRLILLGGAWYLLSGLAALTLGDSRALAPWTMALGFGLGQALVAATLYISQHTNDQEENDDSQ